jgi:hypothetical protein
MQIQDFNRPSAAPQGTPGADSGLAGGVPADTAVAPGSPREQAEIALLKKRIEHLEVVVETARSLMTSNQERLLRRLHDLPQELMSLTAVLDRLDGDASSHVVCFSSPTAAAVAAPVAAQAQARGQSRSVA